MTLTPTPKWLPEEGDYDGRSFTEKRRAEEDERHKQEELRLLQRLHETFVRYYKKTERRRTLRPSEKAMMLAEYQRDIDAIKRVLNHYA